MRSPLIVKLAGGFALAVLLASPARADKCKFGPQDGPGAHESDDPDPRGLKCTKCAELAKTITESDPNVWTLDIKYGKPKRLEIKRETKTSEVYWYVYYELTNKDKLERPCFVDVTAESDKGKNTYKYHDSMVPECKEELRKIFGIKEGETLYTSDELCHPGQDTNKLPSKDLPEKVARDEKSGVYAGANARLAFPVMKPGETRKCVALFQKLDTEFDFLTVFFYGLTNTTTSIPTTPDKPDSLNPEASPVAVAAESEQRLVADPKMQEPEANKRKVVERIFAIEFSCTGDEFAKTTRSIIVNEEQWIRPKNLERDEALPPKYHDVGHFGQEIVEPEDLTVEGGKKTPYTFLGRKWIQTEKTIKSDLR